MNHRFALTIAALLVCPPSHADVSELLGAGNMSKKDTEAKYKVLAKTGLSMTRIPLNVGAYWDKKNRQPKIAEAETAILAAHSHGVRPVILFEFYTRHDGDIAQYDFKAIGRAYAGRFRPNSKWLVSQGIKDWGVEHYTAINEPTWGYHNPEILAPEVYAKALGDLADGVHAVDPKLKVSPGGFIEGHLKRMKDHPLYSIGHLYNQGKLDSIDIHRYWDVQHIPMKGTRDWSLQSQFDEVKKRAGITADVGFHTTEFNFKKRMVTEQEAAAGFLTAIWDALSVTGNKGQPVARFAMPWGVFHLTTKDENYGMLHSLDPWKPTARGKVIALVSRLSHGMQFVSIDSTRRGLLTLEGDGTRLWVWHNREGWSSIAGQALKLDDIPTSATQLEVHGWNGKRKTITASDAASGIALPAGETHMIIARH